MKRALYLRPKGIAESHVDQVVKDWLVSQDIEPVEVGDDHGVVSTGSHDLLVFLPYDGGGNYYHTDVSPRMARIIVQHVAEGIEVRTIQLSSTDVDWEDDGLRSVSLSFDGAPYGGNVTLAIMSPEEVAEAERSVRDDHQLGTIELGNRWNPRPPPSGIATNLAPATITMCVSIGEIAMMRRVASADTDGTGICVPAKPDRTLEWLSGMGLFEKVPFEGRTAYRLTERGRQVAAEADPA